MKKCILCGKEHEGYCDRSGWDGVLKTKFNVPDVVVFVGEDKMYASGEHSTTVEKIEQNALKEQERQHVAKKRGRKPKNA